MKVKASAANADTSSPPVSPGLKGMPEESSDNAVSWPRHPAGMAARVDMGPNLPCPALTSMKTHQRRILQPKQVLRMRRPGQVMAQQQQLSTPLPQPHDLYWHCQLYGPRGAGHKGGVRLSSSPAACAAHSSSTHSDLPTSFYFHVPGLHACRYTQSADMWSFGIVLLELARGRPPHADASFTALVMATVHDAAPNLDQHAGSGHKFSNVRAAAGCCLQFAAHDFVELQGNPHYLY